MLSFHSVSGHPPLAMSPKSLPNKLILQLRQGVGSDEYQHRVSQPPLGMSYGEIPFVESTVH